ncbi:myosin regulatory light chain, nonmuscle [Daphnia pulex]|uniref:Myosin regulatory light chain, nonmuscle n=1 Tax=Daphnia pulex TaxID=6669 RepID=E9GJU8_DAPPU|nr:myosin regulatory light chain, nonmuscle [Daphnia pulex]|eukprot:EFX80175.1 myosin regulatory light chain, nonmuscle [Daphnia pulex]
MDCTGGKCRHVRQLGVVKLLRSVLSEQLQMFLLCLIKPKFKNLRRPMIDQNRDGFVDEEDLHDMLASLGKNPTDEYLEAMMNEAPGPINFTMFLTLFGEKLQGTDPQEVIKNAFGCFDEENTGFLNEERLRELLTLVLSWHQRATSEAMWPKNTSIRIRVSSPIPPDLQ